MPDNILFSDDPARAIQIFLKTRDYSRIGVLADVNTFQHCYPLIKAGVGDHCSLAVPSGEEHKNLATCESIWQFMTDEQFDRHSLLIVIGGGVLGDMGGFCAATFKRGIDFILIPTTLLSQVDASIGGKLGVDFMNFKNHIGVFQLPILTLLCPGFLETLPPSEKRSGFAEIIKHALISDREMWSTISSNPMKDQDWKTLIRHSVEFKTKVTAEDPKEKGLRKILNAGHTIGHAIETHLLNTGRKVMHGEAVAAGLITEAYLAVKRNMLSQKDAGSIYKYIIVEFGKVPVNASDDNEIALLTLQDKKNKGNRILCVLLQELGSARWDCEISLEEVKEALAFYRTN
jgi:3-dehydroquinate synthase